MKRRYQWSLALAIVGAILATKTVTISAVALLEGCAAGGAIGFIVGWLLERKSLA
jgi:hypothetical protein